MMNPAPFSESRSFIEVTPDSPFPIQNLPYGMFRKKSGGRARIGVAIGSYVLDLAVLEKNQFFRSAHLIGRDYFSRNTLNEFMAAGRPAWEEARETIQQLLSADVKTLQCNQTLRDKALIPMSGIEMVLPVKIGSYTNFYASRQHIINLGNIFSEAPEALLPNWQWMPLAHHGRVSSIVTGVTDIRRPVGQIRPEKAAGKPGFAPGSQLDFGLEMGFLAGPGNKPGRAIPIAHAAEHIFGMVLVNSWSARDIQHWASLPPGPFQANPFTTVISPWIVTMEALAPFCVTGPVQAPEPLDYLKNIVQCSYDIQLTACIQSARMEKSEKICHTNFQHLYWNIHQQLTQHTLSGGNVKPGDLLTSGILSGPAPEMYASMLELAWQGTRPIRISDAETRCFIEDGDTLQVSGWCEKNGCKVGFGEICNTVLPSINDYSK